MVAEQLWSVKLIRKIVKNAPFPVLRIILIALRWVGVSLCVWPIWWRFIAQDAIVEMDITHKMKRSEKILNHLGCFCQNCDQMNDFKYRLPFWWFLASRANVVVLNWADRVGVDFKKRKDGIGFVYACLASNNTDGLKWALENGFSPNDVDSRGNSLLSFALHREIPDNPQQVTLLLSYGATWYYRGMFGESGEDVLKDSPEWTRWHMLQEIYTGLLPHTRSARKI